MAETKFIKTVTFGGYDKTDVDKRLESLYSQVYELKNELRETKLALEKFKKGTEEEKTHEYVLSVERNKLTEVQVKNESMSERLKAAEEDNRVKEKEISALQETIAELEANLADTNTKLSAFEAGSDTAALSVVFIEAQKSRSMLLDGAKKEAAEIEANSKQAAEDMIIDANNKAAKIIYDAEKEAAQIDADAKNKAEEMKVASGNMKAALLSDVGKIGAEVSKLKAVLEEFDKSGFKMIEASEEMIKSAEAELKRDGVPVFKMPEHFEPELPEEPKYAQKAPAADNTAEKKKNSGLDKLQAMAEALGGDKKKGGGSDLDALAQQAAALGGNDKKKSGGMDLDALAKQAAALGGDKKKSGGVDLDALAKQAAALGGKK